MSECDNLKTVATWLAQQGQANLAATVVTAAAQIAALEAEITRLSALPICVDCNPNPRGYSPCVRHGGAEHGLAGFAPGNIQWDDTWEHWKRRAVLAEAERAPFLALAKIFPPILKMAKATHVPDECSCDDLLDEAEAALAHPAIQQAVKE